jgi:hypothetical protein
MLGDCPTIWPGPALVGPGENPIAAGGLGMSSASRNVKARIPERTFRETAKRLTPHNQPLYIARLTVKTHRG